MKKTDINTLFNITTSDGQKVELEALFSGAEKILGKNFKKYTKNVIPLSLAYCGGQSPYDALIFSIGVICGSIITKKKLKIVFSDDGTMTIPTIVFQMINELRSKLG